MYTSDNLLKLKKRSTLFAWLSVLLLLFSIGFFLLFFFIATRDNRITMKVFGIVLSLLCFFGFIYCFCALFDQKRKINQFVQIMNGESQTIKATFISKKEYPITLLDHSLVHEILVKTEEGEKIFYLSALFDYDFKPNTEYELVIMSDFIKEIHDAK